MKPGIEIAKLAIEGLIKLIPMIRERRRNKKNAPAVIAPSASEMRERAHNIQGD
jgi:hypothetical protein